MFYCAVMWIRFLKKEKNHTRYVFILYYSKKTILCQVWNYSLPPGVSYLFSVHRKRIHTACLKSQAIINLCFIKSISIAPNTACSSHKWLKKKGSVSLYFTSQNCLVYWKILSTRTKSIVHVYLFPPLTNQTLLGGVQWSYILSFHFVFQSSHPTPYCNSFLVTDL